MRWFVVASVVSCALLNAPTTAQPGLCDDEYECMWQAQTPTGITFDFDLKPLCTVGGYSVNDTTGHMFSFNICGNAKYECHPTWNPMKTTGVAVQVWGSAPPCNIR
jgi:hypothetical protein